MSIGLFFILVAALLFAIGSTWLLLEEDRERRERKDQGIDPREQP